MIFIPRSCRCKVVFVVESCTNSGLFRDVLGVWSQITLLEQSVLTRQGALEQRIAEVDAHVAQIVAVERQLSGKVKRWSSVCRTLKQQASQAQASQAVQSSHPVGRYLILEL